MEIQWINNFPMKKHGWYWEISILPTIDIARNPTEGVAVGIGWLFWTIAIYIDLD